MNNTIISSHFIPVSENGTFVDAMTYDLVTNNRIYLFGSVNTAMALEFITNMDYLMKKVSDSVMPEPISIYINSPGGEVYSGLSIVDKIRQARKAGIVVRTVNCGISASMASFFLASGTPGERYSTEHGKVMIHQALGGAQGQADDVFLACEQLMQCQNVLVDILAKDTKHTANVIKKYMNRDTWFTAKEAMDFGLIDNIGFPKEGA